MKLAIYLQRSGLMTGSLSKNTSYSGLEALLRFILGKPPMMQGQAPQTYGTACHEQFLEKKKVVKISKAEQKQIDKAIIALNKNPIVKRLMKRAKVEHKKYKYLKGVELAYILDINEVAERIGADLKTSVITNLEAFVAKAVEYGYFRQAKIYMLLENLKMFFIVVVTKEKNPRVYVFCVSDYPQELKRAEREVEFLLYLYKNYGKPVINGTSYGSKIEIKRVAKTHSRPARKNNKPKKAAQSKKRKAGKGRK